MNSLRLMPMLGVPGEPFDSTDHLFEVKWDGIRALAGVEGRAWQLWGRERSDYTCRYPELELLASLPSGTVLDGELVLFRKGQTDLASMLGRHGLTSPKKIGCASRVNPVTYVVFDLLFDKGQSLCDRPLHQRRRLLAELVAQHHHPRLAFSEELVGSGRDFFAAAVAQGHEGIMAKQRDSRYLPGQRSAAWRKIKPPRVLPCLIIGYQAGRDQFRSLLVAAEREGELQYVGRVNHGFSPAAKAQLGSLLIRRICSKPFVHCPTQAVWVQPDLYCQVRFSSVDRGGPVARSELRWPDHSRRYLRQTPEEPTPWFARPPRRRPGNTHFFLAFGRPSHPHIATLTRVRFLAHLSIATYTC